MRFSVVTALVIAVIVCWGFSSSFLVPLAEHRTHVPLRIYLHALVFFGWVTLYVVQTVLAGNRVALHRRLGMVAFALVPAMAISGVVVARDAVIGRGSGAHAFLLVPLTDIALFVTLASWALRARADRAMHSRLMLVAACALLPPAVSRALALGTTAASFAGDSLIAVAAIRDLRVRGRIHRAYLFGGGLVLGVHAARALIAHTDAWQQLARWIA